MLRVALLALLVATCCKNTRAGTDELYQVFHDQGFLNYTSSSYIVVATMTSGICGLKCAASTASGVTTMCSAAQYDSNTGLCTMAINCGLVQLKGVARVITYVLCKRTPLLPNSSLNVNHKYTNGII